MPRIATCSAVKQVERELRKPRAIQAAPHMQLETRALLPANDGKLDRKSAKIWKKPTPTPASET